MIPKELAKKIRYIEIYTSKAVNDVLAGAGLLESRLRVEGWAEIP